MFSHFSTVASSLINSSERESHRSQGEHRSPAAGAVKSISSVRCFDCWAAGRTPITAITHEFVITQPTQRIVVSQLIISIVVTHVGSESHARSGGFVGQLPKDVFKMSVFFVCLFVFNSRSVIVCYRERLSTLTMSCVVTVTTYFAESFDSLSSRGKP